MNDVSILSGVFRTIQLKARTRQARPRIVFQRATRPPRLKGRSDLRAVF